MTDKAKAARVEGEKAVREAIDAMSVEDRSIGKKLDAIITGVAPELIPRTWYGMPAYSDGNKIICFFRTRQKFGERFMTLGFNDSAKLDDGNMWPIYYAITDLTAADEKKVAGLVKKAVGK